MRRWAVSFDGIMDNVDWHIVVGTIFLQRATMALRCGWSRRYRQ